MRRLQVLLLAILICSEPNMGFQNSTCPPPFVIGIEVELLFGIVVQFTCADTETESDGVV